MRLNSALASALASARTTPKSALATRSRFPMGVKPPGSESSREQERAAGGGSESRSKSKSTASTSATSPQKQGRPILFTLPSGDVVTMAALARLHGLPQPTVQKRYARGDRSIEALTRPADKRYARRGLP